MPSGRTFTLAELTDVAGADAAPDGYVLIKVSGSWVPAAASAAIGMHEHPISQIVFSDYAAFRTQIGLGYANSTERAALRTAIGVGYADAAEKAARRADIGLAYSTDAERSAHRANIGAGVLAGFRNKIINGGFEFYQRAQNAGNVVIGSAASGYTIDRWRVHNTSGISCTVSRLQSSASDLYRYYGQFAFTGTGAAGSNIRQRIERANTLANKRVTVSGYIGSSVAQTVTVTLTQSFGTGGSPSANVETTVGTVALTTGGGPNTYFSMTVVLPSVVGKTYGSALNDMLELTIIGGVANANTIYLANLSVVEGDATAEPDPYEYRPQPVEAALCYRYYQRIYHGIDVLNYGGGYSSYQGGRLLAVMRVNPTATIFTASSAGGWSSLSYSAANGDSFFTYLSGGAGSSGSSYWNGYLMFDAEL